MRTRLLLGPVVAMTLLVGLAAPARAASPDDLITPVPPAGFRVATVPGMVNGSMDLDQMARIAGVEKPAGLDAVGWDGAARAWTGPGNQLVMIIAGRTKSAEVADAAAKGALSGARDVKGAASFQSALPGVDGAVASEGIAHVHLVSWSQGPYVVMTVAATTGDRSHSVIDDVVTREADFLRARYGVRAAPNHASSGGIPGTLVAAGLLALALVVGALWLSRRFRAAPDDPGVPASPEPATHLLFDVATDPLGARPPRTPRPPPAPIPFGREPVTTAPPPAPAEPAAVDGVASWDDRFPAPPAR